MPQQGVKQWVVIADIVIADHSIAGMLAEGVNEVEQLAGLVHPVGYLKYPFRAAGRVDDYRAEYVRVRFQIVGEVIVHHITFHGSLTTSFHSDEAGAPALVLGL